MALDDGVLNETVKAYLAADKSYRATARCLGVTRKTVRRRIGQAIDRGLLAPKHVIGEDAGYDEKIEKEFGQQNGRVTTVSLKIKTVDAALESAEIDLDVWEVDRSKINYWTVTMGAEKSMTGRSPACVV